MVGAVARENLVTAGVHPRDLDRVLVRLGASVREEEDVDVTRCDRRELFAQLRARLGRHERVGVGKSGRLLLDRFDDALVAVADVHAHQLTVEIQISLALRRPEPATLRSGDRDGIHFRLRGPLEDRVGLRARDEVGVGEGLRRSARLCWDHKRTPNAGFEP